MSIYSFIVKDAENPELEGAQIEVQVMQHLASRTDPDRLEPWAIGIADDLVRGLIGSKELVEDAIQMRVTTSEKRIVVDTLAR